MENINWQDLVFGVGLLEIGTRVSWAAVGGILAMVGFWGLRRRVGALERTASPPVTVPVTVNVNPSIRITLDGKDVELAPVADTQMGGIAATVDDKNLHFGTRYGRLTISRDGNARTQMDLARWLHGRGLLVPFSEMGATATVNKRAPRAQEISDNERSTDA